MERRYICPNCEQANAVQGEEWELEYNCPVLVCTHCQKEFLRNNCKEIAVSKVSFDDKLPVSLWAFVPIVIGLVLLICSFHFGSSIVIFRPKNLLLGIGAIIVGFAWIVSGIKNFKKKSMYLKEEKVRSETRCANIEYVEKLNALGYNQK